MECRYPRGRGFNFVTVRSSNFLVLAADITFSSSEVGSVDYAVRGSQVSYDGTRVTKTLESGWTTVRWEE